MLSIALSEALASVSQATVRPLSAAETSRISAALAKTLARGHDAGERDPEALKRAALREVFASLTVH
jgi:hypothetical protein